MHSTPRPTRLGNVPLLVAAPTPRSPSDARPWPTVLWFHGFRSDALAQATELERCASAGFLAVGIDAVGHGARRDATIAERITRTPGGALAVMLAQVDETIAELPSVIAALAATHAADAARVSVVGISMGAFLVYRALQREFGVRAAVALLGSPEWRAEFGPSLSRERVREVALLSVTAEHDASVPPAATRRLHEHLSDRSSGVVRHAYHELSGSGHLTSAAHWTEAMDVTMSWLDRYAR